MQTYNGWQGFGNTDGLRISPMSEDAPGRPKREREGDFQGISFMFADALSLNLSCFRKNNACLSACNQAVGDGWSGCRAQISKVEETEAKSTELLPSQAIDVGKSFGLLMAYADPCSMHSLRVLTASRKICEPTHLWQEMVDL